MRAVTAMTRAVDRVAKSHPGLHNATSSEAPAEARDARPIRRREHGHILTTDQSDARAPETRLPRMNLTAGWRIRRRSAT
eukprot:1181647-Prorocentrum_minimum.AAC.3